MSLIQTLVDTSPWSLFILVIGFISSGFAFLYFKSALAFLIEAVLIAALIWLGSFPGAVIIVSIIQVLYSLFLVYRLMQAIHFNYMLVLEKTNKAPADITEKGSGIRSSFL